MQSRHEFSAVHLSQPAVSRPPLQLFTYSPRQRASFCTGILVNDSLHPGDNLVVDSLSADRHVSQFTKSSFLCPAKNVGHDKVYDRRGSRTLADRQRS